MSDLIFSFYLDISVGQIHAIFKLPLKFQSYKGMLAYIKWFTPLHSFLKDVGMYQIQQSTHMGCPEASIIPIEQIIQMCHLQPNWQPHTSRLDFWECTPACWYISCQSRPSNSWFPPLPPLWPMTVVKTFFLCLCRTFLACNPSSCFNFFSRQMLFRF